MSLKEISSQVEILVKDVGLYIKTESQKLTRDDVEEKGLHDLVSYVDKEAEKRIVQSLSTLIPEAGFIAEEDPALKRADHYNWIIDPLDGTTNFIHRIPVYAISIALLEDNEIVLGVVYEINRDECFSAFQGEPSCLNGKPISVSPTQHLKNSLLATGFPYNDYSLIDPYMLLFEDLMQCSRGIRRLGSAAVDLAYVACGRFESFFEYSLKPWDVAAGAFIVRQAGGIVSDFNNSDNYLFGRQIVASNKGVHLAMLDKIKSHFTDKI